LDIKYTWGDENYKKNFSGKSEKERHIGRRRYRWKDSIKNILNKQGVRYVDNV
jgi:hypothetical protein